MTINVNKSCCIRIGPHCDAPCANITTLTGHVLPWTKEIKYLGIFIVQCRVFNRNHASILYRFRDIASYLSKVADIDGGTENAGLENAGP